MRLLRVLGTLAAAAAAAGCRESPIEPYTPTRPAPSGLPVAFTIGPWPERGAAGADVSAAGDSVVVVVRQTASGCSDYSARAGTADGALVVTIVDSLASRVCNLDTRGASYRAVVRPAPRGRYDVIARFRVVGAINGLSELQMGRRRVSLP